MATEPISIEQYVRDDVREYGKLTTDKKTLPVWQRLKENPPRLDPLSRLCYFDTWYDDAVSNVTQRLPLPSELAERCVKRVLLSQPTGERRLERLGYNVGLCKNTECGCDAQNQYQGLALLVSPIIFTPDRIPEVYWPHTMYTVCATKLDPPANIRIEKNFRQGIKELFEKAWPSVANHYRIDTMADELALLCIYFKQWVETLSRGQLR